MLGWSLFPCDLSYLGMSFSGVTFHPAFQSIFIVALHSKHGISLKLLESTAGGRFLASNCKGKTKPSPVPQLDIPVESVSLLLGTPNTKRVGIVECQARS